MTLNGLGQSQERQLKGERGGSPMFLIALHLSVVDLTANETLGIKDCVLWVGVVRVLGRITDSRRRVNATAKWCENNTYNRSSSVKDTQEGVIR
jgi:hypothetical protein